MVSWWVTDSYINNEQIKIGDIKMMTSAYGSSRSFGSIVRSNSIGHNKYTGRIIILFSKPTPIHGLFHKSHLNYLYSISHFRRLTQEFSKILNLLVV